MDLDSPVATAVDQPESGISSLVQSQENLTAIYETTTTENSTWANESLYYSIESSDPSLRDCRPTILRSDLDDYLAWKWWVGGVIMTAVDVTGLVANGMSMMVLSTPKLREVAFNQLLLILCVVDTIFLFCNSLSCLHALGINNEVLKMIRDCMDAFAHVSMCASVLMIVALTGERHFAIRSPHKYRVHLRTTKRWKHLASYVVPVTVLSFFFNIPMFLNLKRSLMTDVTYLRVNLYLRMLHPLTTTGLAPILILIVLNVRITRGIMELQQRSINRRSTVQKPKAKRGELEEGKVTLEVIATTTTTSSSSNTTTTTTTTGTSRQSSRNGNPDLARAASKRLKALTAKRQKKSAQQNRREIRMTYVTFAIVGIFFLLNLPRMLVGGYEVSVTWLILHCVEARFEYLPNLTFYRWDAVSRLLMVVNSSINFLIYCTGSQQFKEEFCRIFLPEKWMAKLFGQGENNEDENEDDIDEEQQQENLELKHHTVTNQQSNETGCGESV